MVNGHGIEILGGLCQQVRDFRKAQVHIHDSGWDKSQLFSGANSIRQALYLSPHFMQNINCQQMILNEKFDLYDSREDILSNQGATNQTLKSNLVCFENAWITCHYSHPNFYCVASDYGKTLRRNLHQRPGYFLRR